MRNCVRHSACLLQHNLKSCVFWKADNWNKNQPKMMTASLQMSGRSIQRHVQSAMCLFSRQTSSTTNAAVTKTEPLDSAAGTKTKPLDNNAIINSITVFHNRNPRNLELLTISSKPEGYHLDNFEVKFWHKLVVTASLSRVKAEVVHNNGTTVVSATSGEFGIRKFLYKTSDVCAFQTIGKVVARRCLESGINTVFCDLEYEKGTKMDSLMDEIRKGGLNLEEAPVYAPPLPHARGVPTKPWDIIT